MHRVVRALWCAALCLAVVACGSSAATPTSTPPPSPTDTASPTPTPVSTPTPLPTSPPRGIYLLYATEWMDGGTGKQQIEVSAIRTDGTDKRVIGALAWPASVWTEDPNPDQISVVWAHDGQDLHMVTYTVTGSPADNCTPTLTNVHLNPSIYAKVPASLTNHDDHFIWSPDDSKIAFSRWLGKSACDQSGGAGGDKIDVVMMDMHGQNERVVAHNTTCVPERWTSGGASLVCYFASGQAGLMNPATGAVTKIGPAHPD